MSVTDVLVLQFLKTYGVPVLSILGLIVLITNNIILIRNKFLSRLVSKFDSASETLLVDYKKELFKPLHSIVSTDWKLRNKGLIRILEIGLRTGENVKYYPKNSHLLVVDRNVYIKTYLKSKPHLTSCINVENVTVSSGENLRHIPDNSIDAVVGTFVLCSASRMDDLLHEIKRVLAPGGLYFYIEHTAEPNNTFHYKLQSFLTVTKLWPSIFDGCHLNRIPEKSIKGACFSDVTFQYVTLASNENVFSKFMKTYLIGIAAN